MDIKQTNQKCFSSIKQLIKSFSCSELIVCSLNVFISILFFIIMCCLNTNGSYGLTKWQIWIGLIGNLFNIVSVILAIKLKPSTFIWGALASICFGALAFDSKLLGTMLIYWVVCICAQCFLFIRWLITFKRQTTIKSAEMDWTSFSIYVCIVVLLSIGFSFIQQIPSFAKFWSNEANQRYDILLFDSLGFCFFVSVIYLLWKFYTQVWIIYTLSDIALIILWIIKLTYAIQSKKYDDSVNGINMLLALTTMIVLNFCGMSNWKSKNKVSQ